MQKTGACPVCGVETEFYPDYGKDVTFYTCPVCGRFESSSFDCINLNHMASYLLYHRFNSNNSTEYRYHTGLDKETCDKYMQAFDAGDRSNGRPVHMDADLIDNWYPKTFSERIDDILLYLAKQTPHVGQKINIGWHELLSMLFVDRYDVAASPYAVGSLRQEKRDDDPCDYEVQYMLRYLQTEGLIEWSFANDSVDITLTPRGYARVEAIQKNTANGRNVLIAMKFGDDTITLREAIRKGVSAAGYIAIFIDEVPHNGFITPELLKHIRDSKFVVVDLTHQNNGAYFEEGYAMGLGKPVIQLCKKDTRLHFDIAQKNTIMWETETDIPERLANRIKATID